MHVEKRISERGLKEEVGEEEERRQRSGRRERCSVNGSLIFKVKNWIAARHLKLFPDRGISKFINTAL